MCAASEHRACTWLQVTDGLRAVATDWHAELRPFSKAAEPYRSLRGARDKLIRYWAVVEYLNATEVRHGGGRVLFADSRDVVFQRDPFTIPHDAARPLYVFLEDYFRNYANSKINQGHVLPCFGEARVRSVLLSPPRPVSCSGTTMGSRDAVLAYASAMWRELSSRRYSSACLQHDQAMHNWLLWTGGLGSAVRAFSTERGPVTTVGWPEHLYRDRYGRVLNRDGELAHIVHQYDRRPQLIASLGRRYDLVKNPEPPPRTPPPLDTAEAFAALAASTKWPEDRPSDRPDGRDDAAAAGGAAGARGARTRHGTKVGSVLSQWRHSTARSSHHRRRSSASTASASA